MELGFYQGSYTGSSGGISTYYSIPRWQKGINISASQGSTTFRNFPDVVLTADNVYAVSDNGRAGNFGGTSSAAPLWAGFTALVNQQAASSGQGPVGFINPALYAIGKAGNYASDFHDITTGNNVTGRGNGRFSAVIGYELCTGWGTPNRALILALVSPGSTMTEYAVRTSASPANGGTVTGAGSCPLGSEVMVTATANSGYAFVNWTENGNVVSNSASYAFAVNANTTLVANFTSRLVYYTVSLSAGPWRGGYVSGAGTFVLGSSLTVYATPRGR